MEAAKAQDPGDHDHGHQTEPVAVTITIDDPDSSQTAERELEIAGGPTKVPDLKTELAIPASEALWLIAKNGKKKQLADHETHDVKAGDHFEAIVRGGIS